MMRIPASRLAGFRAVRDCCTFASMTSRDRPLPGSLLGPLEVQHDLPGTPVTFTKPRFEIPNLYCDDRPIEEPCRKLFIWCTYGSLENHYHMNHILRESWKEDPLTTLRIIGYMKQIRYASRDETLPQQRNKQFYTAAMWLRAHHPETLIGNVRAFSRLGCLKDLPEVLHRIVRGPFVRHAEKLASMRLRRKQSRRSMGIEMSLWDDEDDDEQAEDVEVFDVFGSREEKKVQQARHAVEMYNSDPCYRSLHDAVSDVFAELLRADLKLLGLGELQKLSLASKWCPSLGSSYDRSTLLFEGIARKLFPYDEYRGIEDAHYAYRVRDRLCSQVLIPLRRALELPEIYMSNKRWSLLPYDRVSQTALDLGSCNMSMTMQTSYLNLTGKKHCYRFLSRYAAS